MSNYRNHINQELGNFWERDETLIIIGGLSLAIWLLSALVKYFVS